MSAQNKKASLLTLVCNPFDFNAEIPNFKSMTAKEKLRDKILKKIKEISDDKLLNIDSYLNDLESRFTTEKSSLSFSGIFEELDLHELTTDLHKSRQSDNNRIPQF